MDEATTPPLFGELGLLGDWAELAACRHLNPEEADRTFFPARGASTRPAKAICATCPVRQDCLEHAIRNIEKFGIWGGKSERERRRYRRAISTRRGAA